MTEKEKAFIEEITKERKMQAEYNEFSKDAFAIMKYTSLMYQAALDNNFSEDQAFDLALEYYDKLITVKQY